MGLSKLITPTAHVFICTGHSFIVQQPPAAGVLYHAAQTPSTSKLSPRIPPGCPAGLLLLLCDRDSPPLALWYPQESLTQLESLRSCHVLAALSFALSHPLTAIVFGHCLSSLAFFPLNPLFCHLISCFFSLYHPFVRFSFLLFFFFFFVRVEWYTWPSKVLPESKKSPS